MSDEAPEPDGDGVPVSRSLAARDAAGVMLGLAALLHRRRFDEDVVDPRLVDTTIRRLRRVGTELLGADQDGASGEHPDAPPDGIAWATQLSWLLAHAHHDQAVSDTRTPDGAG